MGQKAIYIGASFLVIVIFMTPIYLLLGPLTADFLQPHVAVATSADKCEVIQDPFGCDEPVGMHQYLSPFYIALKAPEPIYSNNCSRDNLEEYTIEFSNNRCTAVPVNETG